MESDSRKNEKGQRSNQGSSSVDLPSSSDVPEPLRVRYSLLFGYESDRFLLGYNWLVLPWFGVLFWLIFLATQS